MTLSKNVIHFYQVASTLIVWKSNILFNKTSLFLKNNYKSLSALSMASKMLTLTALFAVMPMSLKPLNRPVYQTNLKFDAGSPLMILKTQREVKIEVAQSEFDKAAQEKAAIQNKPKATVSTPSVAYSDPSDFRQIYKQAGMQFGIPWQLIEAVHQVESGKSGSTAKRSYAGAQGPMQFMPGTWRAYGVDGNGDGKTDACNVVDAIYGAANLLARAGAAEGNIDGALFSYNHATWYVNKVKDVAYSIGM